MPRAAAATLVAVRPNGSLPGNFALGAPVRVAHPSPNTWRMVTTTTAPSVLRLRLSDVPGWQATIDGKPVGLRRRNYAKTYDPTQGKRPAPKIVVVTCMDARLSDLPAILGLPQADIDVIRTGGPA